MKVVFTALGTLADDRSQSGLAWSPTVGLSHLPDFPVGRIELIYQPKSTQLAERVRDDIQSQTSTLVNLHRFDFEDPWDFIPVYSALLDFALAYPFAREEDYYVHLSTGTHTIQICLFLLTETHFFPARLLQSKPPKDKRSNSQTENLSIIDLDLTKYRVIAERFEKQRNLHLQSLKSGIKTKNAAYNRMIEQVETVAAKSHAPILLMGPTGSGKTQLASNIYALKRKHNRVSGEFVQVNCATLERSSALSVLFGHVKGAFTSAHSARKGLLLSADKGVFFMDEIGELPLDLQALLLRAIEEKQFFPMGSDNSVKSDFQLIAGTNRDLQQEVAARRFREDLYARINLWQFSLPALKDRPEDIEPNIDVELAKFCRNYQRNVRLSAEAKAEFMNFAKSPEAVWSANFRDLGAAIERMATLSRSGTIECGDVHEEILRLKKSWQQADRLTENTDLIYRYVEETWLSQLDRFEQAQLNDVLSVCLSSSSISEAGRMLFNHSRTRKKSSNDADRLKKYLSKYGLEFELIRSRYCGLPQRATNP